MARKSRSTKETGGPGRPTGNLADDQLTVIGAVAEVGRAAIAARSVQPDAPAAGEAGSPQPADPPKRSRAELKADIAASRARLAEVVDELEHRLDVGARTREVVADVRADPVAGVKKHPRAAVAAVAAVAAAGTGVVLLVRALLK
jgi:hypothetical protein